MPFKDTGIPAGRKASHRRQRPAVLSFCCLCWRIRADLTHQGGVGALPASLRIPAHLWTPAGFVFVN